MSICPSLHLCVQALSRRIFWTTQPVVTKPGIVVHDHETLFSTTVVYYHDTLSFLQVPRGEPHHRDWRSWKAGSASGASCGEPAPSSRGAASLWPSLAAVSCCELPPFFPHDYSERDLLPMYSTTKYRTLLLCDTTNVMPQIIQKVVLSIPHNGEHCIMVTNGEFCSMVSLTWLCRIKTHWLGQHWSKILVRSPALPSSHFVPDLRKQWT